MASFVDILKEFNLPALFSRKSGSVVGVDIGSSSIKVVQLSRRQGAAVLDTYGELSLGPYAEKEIGRSTKLPPETIAEALSDLLREADIGAEEAGFSIPYASSLTSVIQLPDIEDQQLEQIVPLEARKYIPVPINEVALDWFVIPKDGAYEKEDVPNPRRKKEKPRLDVMIVAIHNETLNDYQYIVEASALNVQFYEIEIFSTIRSVLPSGGEKTPIMVVDMGAATTKTYIVEDGIVRLSHIINRGSQDITLSLSRSAGMSVKHAEEVKRKEGLMVSDKNLAESMMLTLDYIFSEANRVLLNYEQKHNKNVGRVILTGGGAMMSGLLDRAQEKLENDVMLGRPFSKVDAPAFLDEVLDSVGPSFSVATGLALRRLSELE